MQHYLQTPEEALASVAGKQDGLSAAEAEKRYCEGGPNKLAEGKKTPMIVRFFQQMKDPMILILLVAALISGITAAIQGESYADVIIILTVVVINALLGVIQESKAEKAIEALQKMSAATSRVLREGRIERIPTERLVPGDVILLEAGDAVPADARVLESASMRADEAALTGESVPVSKSPGALSLDGAKDVPLGDRKNMVYSGSTIVYGRGKAVVISTGMQTEMGKIAGALSEAKDGMTPLQIKLAQLSKILTWLVLGICAVIFAVNILRFHGTDENFILDSFLIAVSLAVAAIPEGLAAVVTIVLSIGVTNMSKRNAIIRKLTAVETLGCAQIICSDKTGTLTQNRMTVVENYGDDTQLLAKAMSLCSDAEPDESGAAAGEPTENALVNFARDSGIPKPELQKAEPRIAEAPFDSVRKMMSTVHQTKSGIVQYTKGAPDEVLKKCTAYYKDGKALPLGDDVRAEILAANAAMAGKALRVLCGAMRILPAPPEDASPDALEHDLTFLGLVGLIDPVRPEVCGAIAECRDAGIRPIMITGDHKDTAVAIAMELGMIEDASEAITGAQLDEIGDAEYEKSVGSYSVYARVQPEHKVRIVNAWRKNGCVTAMTGDGVNDAPSIKSADIGVGMGITGTDVTKNVADMVLADDNFATIVNAVEEGRRIYDNIRKAIQFLLSSNMSEVLSIFFATLMGFVILKPVHLLWINLITDSLPALALGTEAAEDNLMKREPRSASDGVFAGGVGFDVVYQGLLVTILTMAAYFIGERMQNGAWLIANSTDGTTMAFLTMSMAEIFHSFNMRSQRHSVFGMPHENKFLWGAAALSLLLTTAVLYIPVLQTAFSFEHISLLEYAVALALAFMVIPVVELVKAIQRAAAKKKKK
ncbi:MAG TPA: cation-translocating P-type ATPase [Eubacteriales bacterium]|nr:cation-translocating P-type ATPase [Eubacteriales bacterium]